MSDIQILLWMTGIHLVGFLCVGLLMIPALRDRNEPEPGGENGGSDDGWGNLPSGTPDPGRWPGGGIPLPDAEQSRVRLREPGRIGQKLPQRRPAREPTRRPTPATR
jgi:hypothetical protein